MTEKRPYTLRERAKGQDETRRRIVEAAMELHEEIGPRATTISAIAQRAGVQRLTVYRHFHDEAAVFEACTAHWLTLHPPPDPAAWQRLADPWARLEAALAAFYAYYRATRGMWTASHRDVAEVPALQGPMAAFAAHLDTLAAALAADFSADAVIASRLLATVRHVLAFPVWAELESRGLDDATKLVLALDWLRGVSRAG
ncbi:MAG: TetR/AcrR family transcriptional regulator [Ferrovibrio sp.]|uniref:TetR/AcrR family transcriptional regulator n=1 Tax=Ferrovibrio sp. TaxID=1917215 RepID=UPI00391C3857